MSLSDKKNVQYADGKGIVENQYSERDVKQFIKELKERCDISVDGHGDHCGLFEHDIDELAGEGLI